MLPYQNEVVERFVKLLRADMKNILEIGSDLGGEVASAIAQKVNANVTGINSSEEFPAPERPVSGNVKLIRADGRNLPFPDDFFDAVLSVATMEHVNGLDIFLSEVYRVLKHKRFFYTEFSPIWSSGKGHHVYAVVGSKEARFWKPGKNPIPDYAHLLMTPDEMREYLRSGPCTEELIDPIIQWIYFEESINRCFLEDYIEAFKKSRFVVQSIHFDYDAPDYETLQKLRAKHGTCREFTCSAISAIFRKPPVGFYGTVFRMFIESRKNLFCWSERQKRRAIQLMKKLLACLFCM